MRRAMAGSAFAPRHPDSGSGIFDLPVRSGAPVPPMTAGGMRSGCALAALIDSKKPPRTYVLPQARRVNAYNSPHEGGAAILIALCDIGGVLCVIRSVTGAAYVVNLSEDIARWEGSIRDNFFFILFVFS